MRASNLRLLVLSVVLLLSQVGVGSAEVTLTTDKPAYTVGETVHIEVHNSGPDELTFVSSPWYLIWNSDTETCVIGCLGLPDLTPFPAGATFSTSWDTGLMPDTPGEHLVSVALPDGPTVTYTLTAPVRSGDESWGVLKARFR